jgi:hypothetical protein
MNRPCLVPLVLALVAVSSYSVQADIKTDEKTRVQFGGVLGGIVNLFGGKAAREGVTSAVAVKGDRKATTSDNTGRIVDLTEEKIYDLDIRRKTYKVTTFAELRRQIEEARRKAEEAARKAEPPQKAPRRDPNAKEMEIDFDIKNTGQKEIVGFDTQRSCSPLRCAKRGKSWKRTAV